MWNPGPLPPHHPNPWIPDDLEPQRLEMVYIEDAQECLKRYYLEKAEATRIRSTYFSLENDQDALERAKRQEQLHLSWGETWLLHANKAREGEIEANRRLLEQNFLLREQALKMSIEVSNLSEFLKYKFNKLLLFRLLSRLNPNAPRAPVHRPARRGPTTWVIRLATENPSWNTE